MLTCAKLKLLGLDVAPNLRVALWHGGTEIFPKLLAKQGLQQQLAIVIDAVKAIVVAAENHNNTMSQCERACNSR